MVHHVTSQAVEVDWAVTDVVVGVPSPSIKGCRDQRIAALRDAIRSGDYHVSAANLADALLAAGRRAN